MFVLAKHFYNSLKQWERGGLGDVGKYNRGKQRSMGHLRKLFLLRLKKIVVDVVVTLVKALRLQPLNADCHCVVVGADIT